MSNNYNEINRLNFEDIIWIVFIILSILNIIGNDNQKKCIISGIQEYEDNANKISIFVLVVLLCIYIYFFIRNHIMYNNKKDVTEADLVKVIGSLFFIMGTLCLLYFQINSNDNFIGSPEL